MRPGIQFFHIGIVVPRLEQALDELTTALGYEWTTLPERTLRAHEADGGYRDIPMRLAFSKEEPYIEVIEARAGTPWELSETGSNIHHIAFHADDDLHTASREMADRFCPTEICGVGEDGTMPATFAYHSRGGLRFELVSRKPTITAWRDQG
jgi:catechol 2,3-dioxygenase-like lactoylglutathione lyase family enzyme